MINDSSVLDAYLAEEIKIDHVRNEFLKSHPDFDYGSRANKWNKRVLNRWAGLTEMDFKIPASFLKPYDISAEEFFEAKTALKYQMRGYSCLRELIRMAHLCPEVLDEKTHYHVLELSSGPCGNVEVLPEYNNTVQATDFLDGLGSAYIPIHRALGIAPLHFNGSILPYGFGDKSYDYVLSYQAIDAYGPPRKFPRFAAEMARIARKKVILIMNPHRGGEERRQWFYGELRKVYPKVVVDQCPDTSHPAVIIHLAE